MSFGMVALTFDDGPDPVFTEKVLNALDQVSVKATFFVVGDQIQDSNTPKQHPAGVIHEIQARGHAIQLHRGTHETHTKLTRHQIESDGRRALDKLSELGVLRPCVWRPPLGSFKDPESCQAAAALGPFTANPIFGLAVLAQSVSPRAAVSAACRA